MKRLFIAGIIFHLLPVLTTFAQPVIDPEADAHFTKGEWKQALVIYKKIGNTDTSDLRLIYRTAFCYLKINDYDHSIAEYKKILALNAPPAIIPTVNYNISCAYSQKKIKDSAVKYLRLAVESGSFTSEAIQNDADLILLQHTQEFSAILKRADELAENSRYPCRNHPESRQFDFWVGEWNVYPTNALSTLVGTSRVEKIVGDCALLENWQPKAPGPGGKSFNLYDPQTKKWEQHYINGNGSGTGGAYYSLYENGEYRDGAMRFTSFTKFPNGQETKGKLTFFNLESGKVRQLYETSNDGGKTWTSIYDFTYIRK